MFPVGDLGKNHGSDSAHFVSKVNYRRESKVIK